MIRDEFPVLADCVYLNSNSTGAKPRGAEQVLRRYWETLSTWRDEVWDGWLDEVGEYTRALADFLGAPTGTVVTDTSLTTLLGRLGTCFDFSGKRNKVITTDLEFPTVPFIWRGFGRYGAKVEVVGSGGTDFDEEALEASIDEETLLVCVSHGSYRTGAVLDLDRIVTRAHAMGAYVAIDAFQTVGTVPLDVRASGVDFVLGGANKWMCGVHTAFLYVRPELIGELRPAATGWFAGDDPLSFGPIRDWAPDAARFAGGTPVPIAVMISRVGLDLIAGVGSAKIREHSLRCTDLIIQHADEAGLEILTPRQPERRGGVITLNVPDGQRVAARLGDRGMVCTWRDGLRIGPHIYNTLDEVAEFMTVLGDIAHGR